MDESDLEYSDITSIRKAHKEILDMLEEIKDYEKKFVEFDLEEPQVDKELIEVEYETFQEIEPELVTFKEVEEKKPEFEIKRKKDVVKKIEKPITPTTFRLRINEEGNLENIDLKKSEPRSKRHFRIRFRKKDQIDSEDTEKKSRFAKLKSGLSKIRRAIPSKKEEKEEIEEPEETETSEAFI